MGLYDVVAYSGSVRRESKVSDCIFLDGLVAPVMLARSKAQAARGGLVRSSVPSVSGDRPEHSGDVRIVGQVLAV